jgi:hypothetical protein
LVLARPLVRAVVCLAAVGAALALPPPALAQPQAGDTGRPTLTAMRIPDGQTVRIDGALDDAAWSLAAVAGGFRQRDPDNGAAATERSEIRVLYDRDALVIGAMLFDSEPDRVLGNQMQRDQSFSADDRFIVTLDTFMDGRSGYVFQTNPAGALFDALIAASGNSDDTRELGTAVNPSWDGIWTARVRRVPDGWSAEIEIPFRTLNFEPGLTAWGINFQRTVRRKSEESVWTGHLRTEGVAQMSSAGRLEGLGSISQGAGLDAKPYVVGNLSSAPGRGRPDRVATGDVGLDLFYNLTPALRANLSINTDFAETEVDQRRVNLTRFPLFFEEKRDFFLQGASYFDFGREFGNMVTPFFSRRIGLDADGVPQPIDVGAKLTGQMGAFDIGLLQVRAAGTGRQPGADFTVARVRRRFFQQSYAGVLYTRRADRVTAAPRLHTAGIDFSLRTATFLRDRTADLSGWYLYTSNPLDTGRNIGRGMRLQFPNDPFYFDFSYRELQHNYTPAVGFLQRSGFRRYNPEVGYTWRFRSHPWLRSVQHEIDWEFYDDPDHGLITEVNQIKPLTVVFNDGSDVSYEAHVTYEQLVRDFDISEGVTLPVGEEYRFTRHEIAGSMSDRYPVAAGAQVVLGRFYSGRAQEYQVDLRVRPRSGVALTVEAERNVLDLAEGRFSTTLYRLGANTQFSPWLSLSNNLQYDDVSQLLGWQMRVRWIQRPGNDLFFVYTHNWQEVPEPAGRRLGTLDNRAATKLVYTLRF